MKLKKIFGWNEYQSHPVKLWSLIISLIINSIPNSIFFIGVSLISFIVSFPEI